MQRGGYIYIISNKTKKVLYIGVTSSLHKRICEHRAGKGSIFTSKYNCKILLHYEFFHSIIDAIKREKKLKKWNRSWKIDLIKKNNPEMKDLFPSLNPYDYL